MACVRYTCCAVIPLRAIFEAAARSPVVKRAAVGVVVVAVVLYGVKLAFGSNVRMTTTEAADCAVSLSDKSARLELTEKALDATTKALDLCAGEKK